MAANLLIALGSNRRHGRYGAPAGVVVAAIRALGEGGFAVVAQSQIHATAAVGPGGRGYANAVVAAASELAPRAAVATLKQIEAAFGRRGGKRWGARVLDLDLLAHDKIVPSALGWRRATQGIIVPHPRLHVRAFVLDPLAEVAPGWRHPVLGATVRQLRARLRRPKRDVGSP